MSVEISVNTMQDRNKDKNNQKINLGKYIRLIPLYIIIPFLGSFFTLWYFNGSNPIDSLRYYIFSNSLDIVYDTYVVSIDSSVPEKYVDQIKDSLGDIVYEGVNRFEFVDDNSDILISANSDEESYIFSEKLIPVAHLYSLVDDFDSNSLDGKSVFVVNKEYERYLEDFLNIDVDVLDSVDSLVSKLGESDSNIGLVLFSDINPELKVLFVNKEYYLDNTEASISINFSAILSDEVNDFILSVLERNLYLDLEVTQFDESYLAKVNMTGVTAMSRGLASKMDPIKDYDYPAENLGEFLADADLTHTSNEVSFVDGCAVYDGMRFCSKPEYMDALIKSGIDIVELTGNHNNDFGSTYSADSIKRYTDLGMRYFGGGLDSEDASKILYEEVNGNTVAFLGYNYYDTMLGTGALASASRSGANSYSVEKMQSDIKKARENADVVIVDFQFQECYCYPSSDVIYPVCYRPLSNPDQKGTFKKAIDFGADIVIGTQAHQPQTFEVYNDGVIFYGLGNLYFDQDNWIGTRQGLVLTHYFYNGNHIQTKITPIYMDYDLKPDFATESEGDLLMRLLKEAR